MCIDQWLRLVMIKLSTLSLRYLHHFIADLFTILIDLNLFFQLYRQAELNEEKVRLLQATGATSDVDRLRKVLQFSLSVNYFITFHLSYKILI